MASGFIATNWGLYIWAVNNGHVVETALGYFINPLVSVLLGVVVLRERMRRAQWIALGLVSVAVVILAVDYGGLPWIAIVLPVSFGLYGLHKKRAGVGAVESLAFETALLAGPAIGYLAWLEVHGAGVFGHPPWTKSFLFIAAGPATAIPLLCFGAAANRVPLSTLGLLQYISPTLQFLCGVYVFHEAMPPSRWLGFALVWVALLVFSADGIAASRKLSKARRVPRPASPEGVGASTRRRIARTPGTGDRIAHASPSRERSGSRAPQRPRSTSRTSGGSPEHQRTATSKWGRLRGCASREGSPPPRS